MSKFRFCKKCLTDECDIRDNTELSNPISTNLYDTKFNADNYNFIFPVTKASDQTTFVVHVPRDIMVNDSSVLTSSESPQSCRSSQTGTPQNRRRSVKFTREDLDEYVSEKHPKFMPSSPRSREGSRIGNRPNSRRSSLSYSETPVPVLVKANEPSKENDEFF